VVVAALGASLGRLLGDVVITRQEIGALTAGLLVSHDAATGSRSFAEWLPRQSDWLGRRYANELDRNWRAS
jgi:hypothetical protein